MRKVTINKFCKITTPIKLSKLLKIKINIKIVIITNSITAVLTNILIANM